jgi:hypothetical protein
MLSGFATRHSFAARAGCALALSACLLMASRPAAGAPKVPARLVWHGSVCGTAEGFAARVLERTNAVRFVRRGQVLAVRLRIERSGSGLDASVSIEARGHPPLQRHIQSPDCEDALDALALVVAIGIEGRAPSAPAPAATSARRRPSAEHPPAEPEAMPAEPLPADEPAPDVLPTAPALEAAPASAASPAPELAGSTLPTAGATLEPPPAALATPKPREPEVDAPEPARAETATRFQLGVGLSAQMSIGVAPEPLIGGALWIAAGLEGRGIWSPEVLISATHQRLDGLPVENGEVDFALSSAGVSACPVRVGSPTWQLRPCAGGSLGRLASEGHDTYDPRSRARPWRALGGSLELTAAIGIVELRASLGAAAPLIRDGFRFGAPCSGAACEADVFHRVAPVIWSGAAGAGINFW